ncbi:hypothetical protein A9W98_35505 [Mycobacterium gordonae]|uniref:ESX-1 secretion-associated protein EspA/EspE-like domain-containing protein n=1 Tax=Mycobacterium gordonae TaxID=1778 RepID=A0A1A6B800_MYCGO|nr:EspA/EspE family type VII secretion system effector [Mycobacterium gordonae]MBI2698737.1 hypothetical protein [Mycobacterium sp.]OBR98464.1 hypothetical protein A9W98_35505 [Mycobacterium gordonae]
MGALVILNSTISFLETLYATLGVGTPVTGEVFDTSSSTFLEAIETQASTVLSDNWLGTAADAYSEKSKTLQDAEQIMADVDYTTGTLVSDQADAVEKARNTLKKWINFLEDCKPYAKALYDAIVTIADSYVFQAAVSAVAVTASGIALLELLLTTFENAEKLVESIEEIVELMAQLPSDFTEDLAALSEGLLSALESGISDLVSDVESEVSELVSAVKSEVSGVISALKSELSDLSLSDLSLSDLSLSDFSSLSDLSSLMSMSGLTSLSDASALSDLTSLPGSSALSGSTALSGLTATSSSAVSPGLLTRFAGYTGFPTSEQTKGELGALDKLADEESQTPQAGLPPSLVRRSSKDAGGQKGAAAGAAGAERAPVNAAASGSTQQRTL